jgi:hypothetical protein
MAENAGFSGGSVGDQLMQDLSNLIGTNNHPRIIVPITHLYLEHIFELVLIKTWNDSDAILSGRTGYLDKLRLLYARNIIDKERFTTLKVINSIRNEFAHSFDPNDARIENLSEKLKGHGFTSIRPWLERYIASCIDNMSVLSTILEN